MSKLIDIFFNDTTVVDYCIQNMTLIFLFHQENARVTMSYVKHIFLVNCFAFMFPSCLIKYANSDKTTAVHAGSANRLLNNNKNSNNC
jgi:hypothetical protein